MNEEIKIIKEQRDNIEKDIDKFLEDTNGENDFVVVLRGHLYIEHEIGELLKFRLVEPDLVFNDRFMFANKLTWAVAIGMLPKDAMSAYVALNKIRNKYAHKLDAKLTEKDFNDLISGFDAEIGELYRELNQGISIPDESLEWRIRKVIITLWMHLKLLIGEYELNRSVGYDTRLKEAEKEMEEVKKLLIEEKAKTFSDVELIDRLKFKRRILRKKINRMTDKLVHHKD
ncbi:hypothetical protein ABEY80_22005 [Priestia megaterium]